MPSPSFDKLTTVNAGVHTDMAAEPRNVSGGTGWSRGDIVELVALIIGIPAAIGAVFMLATYYKRRSKGRKGKTLFFQGSQL